MKNIIYSFCLIFLSPIIPAQTIPVENFKNVESICFCNTTKFTPNSILEMDNNWEIVQALIQPKTTSQLDTMGIKYSSSQLELLEDWSIISKSGDNYQTALLIFDSTRTSELRKYSVLLSKNLVPEISDDIKRVKNVLKKMNREKNIFSILFSYILDGMVWDYLEADSISPNSEITSKRPFWAGEFWILYPKRSFSCGTNSISDKGYSIKVNWSENAIPRMKPFVTRWDILENILNDLIRAGRVENKDAIDVFGPYNFFNEKGEFSVPVIYETDNNELYLLSKSISDKVNKFLISEPDLKYLEDSFGFKSNAQALIILYHEMLWDILSLLESEKLINRPLIFRDPQKASMNDVSDLIIITRK